MLRDVCKVFDEPKVEGCQSKLFTSLGDRRIGQSTVADILAAYAATPFGEITCPI